jgi:hypothetical protein
MNNDARHAAIRTKLIRIRDELLTARSHSTGPTNTNAVNTSSTGASAIQDSTTSAQQYVEPAAPAKRQLTATEMAHRKEFFDSRLGFIRTFFSLVVRILSFLTPLQLVVLL